MQWCLFFVVFGIDICIFRDEKQGGAFVVGLHGVVQCDFTQLLVVQNQSDPTSFN